MRARLAAVMDLPQSTAEDLDSFVPPSQYEVSKCVEGGKPPSELFWDVDADRTEDLRSQFSARCLISVAGSPGQRNATHHVSIASLCVNFDVLLTKARRHRTPEEGKICLEEKKGCVSVGL